MTWEKVKLGEVVRFNYGKALISKDRDATGQFDVFGSSGVVGRHNTALIQERSVIVGRKGSAGLVTDAPRGGWPIDTAYYLTSTENYLFDWRYLFYALRRLELPKLATATAMPGLNREDAYQQGSSRIPGS
ncbi:hypothetical protein DVJ83_16335 (plasmid) [Deinococcus wulumuqiensis]|uniref:Type I restriction modification DNA specificity domain-containing protein n=1 Tax=Deinococcus wulumuqiensis TaxID=980427 RepID=A0A345ILZ6_9DEIO|nr:restriction endonuclease subunit S [Deinococcus wulumuqiensis]AXH00719.1 hypothetical protein DVJ83_16335 [Deinococcus wulumuqiensis]